VQRRQKHARHGGRVMLASLHVLRVRRGEVGYGLWGTGQRMVSLSANALPVLRSRYRPEALQAGRWLPGQGIAGTS